jgi:hypothetical protein
MFIHIIADSPAKVADLRSKLVSRYTVSSALLNSGKAALDTLDAVIVAIDLRIPENISALREQLGKPRTERKRIFIIEQRARILNVQAYALGATSVLSHRSVK